jgi:hypothetical protein
MDEHVKAKLSFSFQEKLRSYIEFNVFTVDVEIEDEEGNIYELNSTLYAEGGRSYPYDRDLPPETDPPFIRADSFSLVMVDKEGLICYLDDEAKEIVEEGIFGHR